MSGQFWWVTTNLLERQCAAWRVNVPSAAATIKVAGHFMISTHADRVGQLIAEHVHASKKRAFWRPPGSAEG
jgi:hypothetical protein